MREPRPTLDWRNRITSTKLRKDAIPSFFIVHFLGQVMVEVNHLLGQIITDG